MRELSLQEIQQNSFQVLLKFKEICEENHFRYFLAYGTLIGAIRHKGFIPWDDDIDVWMPRPDYERFIQYCIDHENELGDLVLKHHKTCKEYIYPIARLVDTRYKIDYSNTKEYGLGLFIDIYPLDGVNPRDKSNKKYRKNLVRQIFLLGADRYLPSRSKFRNIFKKLYYLKIKNQNVNKLLFKDDVAAQKYNYANSEYVGCAVWEPKELFDKSDFADSVEFEFNGQLFKAPVGYDNLLKKLYGDYMQLPPESERIAHHYYKAYEK